MVRNRNGTEYSWKKVEENTYKFEMNGVDINWCRYGGQEGAMTVDYNDLGFFDPSGGPFIGIGSSIWDEKTDSFHKVIQISSTEEGIIVRVES